MTQFDFYLINLSFRSPQNTTIDGLKERVEQLSEDCEFIRENDEKIYRHSSIYEETLWKEHTISDLCHTPESADVFGRDYQYMLQVIIDHSADTNWEEKEILELLAEHNEELVSGLLCLYEPIGIEPVYCVYNKNDWYNFHRYFLGLYPLSENHFAEKCGVYFPALHFHQNISHTLGTLEGGLINFPIMITNCLALLNDELSKYYNPQNIPQSLKEFSSACGIETSNEGDVGRKKDLSFSFIDDGGEEIKKYCEPHMKISKSDNTGDSKHYHNRIYFHFGDERIAKGKTLIGHIGRHL